MRRPSGRHRWGVAVVDHVAGGGRFRAAARAAALGLDLQPGLAQGLGKVVVHRACDGHRVGHWLRFLVVLAQAAAEVLLDDGVAGCVGWGVGGVSVSTGLPVNRYLHVAS